MDDSAHGDEPAELVAKHVIISTGSKPRALPGVAIDNVRVLDNAGALAIPAVGQFIHHRLWHVFDNRKPTGHIAVERGIAHAHFALVPGRQHEVAKFVGESH